jgi:hypothetical protein
MARKRTKPQLNERDRVAMMRSIEAVRRMSVSDREDIDERLKSEPFEDVGHAAAYAAQCASMQLRPWQSPPVWVRDIAACLALAPDDCHGLHHAADLLVKMFAADLSQFVPDPIGEVERSTFKITDAEIDLWTLMNELHDCTCADPTLDQRFRGLNHIRRPRRVCRTKCG